MARNKVPEFVGELRPLLNDTEEPSPTGQGLTFAFVLACRGVRLRPSGYGATAFAWLAEPQLTLDDSQA